MACGGCKKRRNEFLAKQRQRDVIKESIAKEEVEAKSKEYYNPDEDINYKLVFAKDNTLTQKQKRIKNRILRMKKRADNKAREELSKLENKKI